MRSATSPVTGVYRLCARIRLRATCRRLLHTRGVALAVHGAARRRAGARVRLAGAGLATGTGRGCCSCCSRSAVIADFNEIPLPGRAALRRRPAARADHARGPRPAARRCSSTWCRSRSAGWSAASGSSGPATWPTSRPTAGRRRGAALLPRPASTDARAGDALPWLLLAGVVMCVVNFASARRIYVPLYLGQPGLARAADVRRSVPAALVMVAAGGADRVLVPPLGVARAGASSR